MGYYGDEKRLQMMRSLLPSKARKGARDARKTVHRQNRNNIKQKICHYKGKASDVMADYEEDGYDLEYFVDMHNNGWDSVVEDRRNADKIAPYIRWATAITQDIPQEDRYDYMRSITPNNLIGRHALSHIEYLDHFENSHSKMSWYKIYLRERENDTDRQARIALYRRQKEFRVQARKNFEDTIRAIARDDKRRAKMNKWLERNVIIEQVERRRHFDGRECDVRNSIYFCRICSKYAHTKFYQQINHTEKMRGYHDCERFLAAVWKDKFIRPALAQYFNIQLELPEEG